MQLTINLPKLPKRKKKLPIKKYRIYSVATKEYECVNATTQEEAFANSRFKDNPDNLFDITVVEDNCYVLDRVKGCQREYLSDEEIPKDALRFRWADGAFLYMVYRTSEGVIGAVLPEEKDVISSEKAYRYTHWPELTRVYVDREGRKREKINTGLTFGLLFAFIITIFIFAQEYFGMGY